MRTTRLAAVLAVLWHGAACAQPAPAGDPNAISDGAGPGAPVAAAVRRYEPDLAATPARVQVQPRGPHA